MSNYSLTNQQIAELKQEVELSLASISKNIIGKPKNYITGKTASYCPRLSFLNAKMPADATLTALPLITAEFGKIYEAILLNQLRTNNILAGYSLTINTDLFPVENLNYFGVIDGVINVNGKYVLVDIKTKHEVKELKPEPQDIAQVSFYSAITGLPCALIYLSRKISEKYNEVSFEIVPVQVDPKYSLHMAFFASYCIKHNILPRIPKTFKKTVHCKHCDFNDYCWSEKPFPTKFNEVTMAAYEITEKYTDDYLANIDDYRDQFIKLMLADKLKGRYFKTIEEILINY